MAGLGHGTRRAAKASLGWYITELLRRYGGNVSQAARAARMDRSYLGQLIKRYLTSTDG